MFTPLKKLIDKLFLVKEITSKMGELHFQRWRLFNTRWLTVCIHKILKSDQDLHCHNHPWSFVSFILNGGYTEYHPDGSYDVYRAGNLNIKKSTDFHKISLLKTPTWTLVFTGPRNRKWGYSVNTKEIGSVIYRQMKNNNEL